MKKKVLFSTIIFALILLSIVFITSYVQAFSKEEKLQIKKEMLEQEVKENKITEEEASQIYKNIETRVTNCDNVCGQNENCPIYQHNTNCIGQNNQCIQRNYHNIRNCGNQQNCHNRN